MSEVSLLYMHAQISEILCVTAAEESEVGIRSTLPHFRSICLSSYKAPETTKITVILFNFCRLFHPELQEEK